jgi:ubiquinone biosynthesis protein COQ4
MTTAYAVRSLEPRRALRAVAALMRNPDDTAQVFTIIEALSGSGHASRLRRRFARDPVGARLLRDRPDLLPLLLDREALRRMPEGSLGRAYLEFVESEGITAEGLVEASRRGEHDRDIDPEIAFVRARMRDTHDLWHALLGYRGDTVGEAALLAFMLAQTGNPGIALIVVAAFLRAFSPESRALMRAAFRRGLDAAWLPAVDWEPLLSLPVEDVRALLRVGTPPAYTPVRTSDLRAAGRLAA